MTESSVASAPALSVVVPSHNRVASVLRLLGSLRAEVATPGGVPAGDVEVIVVCDGSTDGTAGQLRASIARNEWPFALAVVEHATSHGPGVARNSGAAVARGLTLLFIDDDIEPFSGSLAMHLGLHADAAARCQALVVIGAPVPLRAPGHSLQHIAAWGWWEQQFERMSKPGHRFTYDEIFTGVLSVPRALFVSIGGFDVALGRCHEDSELGLRLFRAGARTAFSRAAGGVHHEVRDLARLLPRKWDEGRADVRLLQRWPELSPVVRVTDRLPPRLSLHGMLRRSAAAGGWHADVMSRLAVRLLGRLDQMRLRHTWRLVHGALLSHYYWRGVAEECRSSKTLARLQATWADGERRWHADVHHVRIDVGEGLVRAEQQLDELRPDTVTLLIGETMVGEIRAMPQAERLHGGHLRQILGMTMSHAMQLALTLCEIRSGATSTAPLDLHEGCTGQAASEEATEADASDWPADIGFGPAMEPAHPEEQS